MGATKIAWTQETWNPVTGCSRVSEGCRHCYAESLSLRYEWSKAPWTAQNAVQNVVCHPDRLGGPAKLKEPRRIFVNSMSDLFHEQVPDEFIRQVFTEMRRLPRHRFLVLTKRPERMVQWPKADWMPWIWAGVSVENRKALPRIDALRATPAWHRFLSVEPLLEDLGDVDLTGVDWVIVGGESGPGYRPMDHAWARSLRDQAQAQGAAYFFKQSAAPRTGMGEELIAADGSRNLVRAYPKQLVVEHISRPALALA